MAIKGSGFTAQFKIIVVSTGAASGDESANLTVALLRDGAESAATNPAEYVANGWHTVAITDAESRCDTLALDVVCATDDRFVQPVSYNLATDGAGPGANVITVVVATAGGVTFEGVRVSASNDTGTTFDAVQFTNSDGEVAFNLAADDWRFTAAGNGTQGGGHLALTVDGDDTVTITVTALALPTPADPSNYLLYCDERHLEGDAPFAAAGGTVKVVAVDPRGQTDAAAHAMRHIMGTSYAVNAGGQWSFEIAKALDGRRLRLQFGWTDTGGDAHTEDWEATVDGTKANDSDQLPWADLLPILRG